MGEDKEDGIIHFSSARFLAGCGVVAAGPISAGLEAKARWGEMGDHGIFGSRGRVKRSRTTTPVAGQSRSMVPPN